MGLLPKIDDLLRTLERIARLHAPAALSSSLSAEDMVITDAILGRGLGIEIFTLDTGRLHAETLALIDTIETQYGHRIRVVQPDPAAVAFFVDEHGSNAFYESVELRHRCCEIRKVEPLRRALDGKKAWVTGLREVPGARDWVPAMQFDAGFGLVKFNPLAQWSPADVWAYVRDRHVPYNRLYDHGYRSIGCAPCTRPTLPHEDERTGRWWWEIGQVRECGLHVGADGTLERTKELA